MANALVDPAELDDDFSIFTHGLDYFGGASFTNPFKF